MSASDMPKNSLLQDLPPESVGMAEDMAGVIQEAEHVSAAEAEPKPEADILKLGAKEHGDSAIDQPEGAGPDNRAVAEADPTETPAADTPGRDEPENAVASASPEGPSGPEPSYDHELLDADMLRHGARATLYVFSGPHLGAEIDLPLGTFLVGSDASCDIILNGTSLAPRHASLSVVMTSGSIRVDVKPLDGAVSLEGAGGQPSKGECQPAAGEPWYLGLTCLAWNRPGMAQSIPRIVVGTNATPDDMALGDDTNETAANSVGSGPVSAMEVGSDGVLLATPQVLKLDTSSRNSAALDLPSLSAGIRKKGKNISKLFAVLLLFFLLAMLSVLMGPTSIDPKQYTEIVEKKIANAGLPLLEVTNFGYGVEVRGEVKSDAERAKLYGLAQDLLFPVYLDRITVQNDQVQAVRTAFTARGFLPSVVISDVVMPLADFQMGKGAVAALTDQSETDVIHDASDIASRAMKSVNQGESSNIRVGSSALAALSAEKGTSSPNASPVGERSEDDAAATKSALTASSSLPDAVNNGRAEPTGSPAATDTTQIMIVSAYIQDRLLEENLFAALKVDVPNLPPIKRNIVHQEELEQVLQPALDKAGLGFAEVHYLPNKVEVAGAFDQEALMRARMVLEETGRLLGIPLPSLIQVRVAQKPTKTQPQSTGMKLPELASLLPLEKGQNESNNAGLQPNTGDDSAANKAGSGRGSSFFSGYSGDVLGGLRVTGVTMTPMRFVTTADGQRLFEGSELPSGYTLETISISTLTLSKGGQMITYPLRGAS